VDLASQINSIDDDKGRTKKTNLNDVVSGRISEVLAAQYIRSRLESTRCLIVLDDVWR
ncbi:hypothetical protein KI387_021014, partial [Taxus chinensis]